MRVRIRIKPDLGSLKNTTNAVLGDNRKVARASASLLTPLALMPFGLSMWRLGADMGFGSFAIRTGLFSHWQIWLGVSGAVQCLSIALNRRVRTEHRAEVLQIAPAAVEEQNFALQPPAAPIRKAKILQFPAPGTIQRRIAQG